MRSTEQIVNLRLHLNVEAVLNKNWSHKWLVCLFGEEGAPVSHPPYIPIITYVLLPIVVNHRGWFETCSYYRNWSHTRGCAPASPMPSQALCNCHARLRDRPGMIILPWHAPCLCGRPDLIQDLMFELKDAIMKERNMHWNWNAVERAKHLKPFKKPRAASCCNRCFLNPMVSVKQKGEFVSCLDIFAQEQK